MGLTIHYKLAVAENLAEEAVRDLAERTAQYAQKIGCVRVSPIIEVEGGMPFTDLFVNLCPEEEGCYDLIPAERGWMIDVLPGEGSESARFGLCQYPREVPFRGGSVPTGYTGGWLLTGFCKTQYAAEHGWDHFLKCHRQIISLLDFWKQFGATVEVTDEGEYWETRSEETLRRILNRYDGLVAAVAGAMKDAADDAGKPNAIRAPIFSRKDFERLEAEGQREFGDKLSQLPRIISEVG